MHAAPSFLQIVNGEDQWSKFKHKSIPKQFGRTLWLYDNLMIISVCRSSEEWAHPRSSTPHKLVDSRRAWHPLPLFPGQRAMWNIPRWPGKKEKTIPNHPKPPSKPYNSCKAVRAWDISTPRCSGYFRGTPGSTKQLVSHGASLASRARSDWKIGGCTFFKE